MDRRLMAAVIVVAGAALGTAAFLTFGPGDDPVQVSAETTTTTSVPTTPSTLPPTTTSTLPPTTTTTIPVRATGSVPAWTVGQPWGSTPGLTMFRGNPTRTFHGTGPLPDVAPEVLWRYPEAPMCGTSV
ncbi:MAG: hypothetical protein R3246_02160, partial [Acidimicrobiia bacterium]|nr:hypothetical protein [Acidimicrobiia bacterium]